MNSNVMQQTPAEDRRNKIILSICLVAAIAGSIFAVTYRWESGVDAQNHAVRVMFSVTGEFMEEHDGRWPKNWEELEMFPSEGHWYDPINFEFVRQHVIIDFEPNLAETPVEDPTKFQAIRPVNPVFDFGKDPRLIELMQTIDKYHISQIGKD